MDRDERTIFRRCYDGSASTGAAKRKQGDLNAEKQIPKGFGEEAAWPMGRDVVGGSKQKKPRDRFGEGFIQIGSAGGC